MSSVKIVELTEANTCKLCENAIGKYSCPRCNVLYCSLTCYQSMNHLECSESFYKDCVLENFKKSDNVTKETEEQMKSVFQRLHEQNKVADKSDENASDGEDCDEDDDDDEWEDASEEENELDSDDDFDELFKDLGVRLSGIDLDNSEDVWEQLTDTEKKEFEAFLTSGEASKYLSMWEPWWEYHCDKRIVELDRLEEQKLKCPKINENIVPIAQLSVKPPAGCVQNNMMNVIASYAFTLRYFNGEHYEFPHETCTYVYRLSLNLSKNQNFDSFKQAILSVSKEVENYMEGAIDEENSTYIETDVQAIVTGPHSTEKKLYLLSGLSDFTQLLTAALKTKGSDKPSGEFHRKVAEYNKNPEKLTNDEIKKTLKKVEYYLSYAKYAFEM